MVCVVCDTFVPEIVRLFCKIFWKLARILAAAVFFRTPCTFFIKTFVWLLFSVVCSLGAMWLSHDFFSMLTCRSSVATGTGMTSISFAGFGGTLCPFRRQCVNKHSRVVYSQSQSKHLNSIPQHRSCSFFSEIFANDLSHFEHCSFFVACTFRKCCRRYLRDLKNCKLWFCKMLYLHFSTGQKYCTSDSVSISFLISTPWCFSKCIFKLLKLVNLDEQPATMHGFCLFSIKLCSFRINFITRFFSIFSVFSIIWLLWCSM